MHRGIRTAGVMPLLLGIMLSLTLLSGSGTQAQEATPTGIPTISIPASQAWTDTGLSLSKGDQVTITASGTIYIAGSDPGKTPAGDPNCTASADFVAPGLPCWSLIGRIGNGAPFEVGTATSFSVARRGRLYLGVNDNYFPDNTGSWSAMVTVSSVVFNKLPWVAGKTWFFKGGPHCDGVDRGSLYPEGSTGVRYGLDFFPPSKGNRWVVASAPGLVRVGAKGDCLVEIEHVAGLRTGYYHLDSSSIRVNVGDQVSYGTHLGLASTEACRGGSATGNHVHFYFCYTPDPNAVCLNNYSRLLPANGTMLSGWTINETAGNYNGTMTKPLQIDRIASEFSCEPDRRTEELPPVCNGQRNDLESDNK